MANYKYDISVIDSCIKEMRTLANSNVDKLAIETQNKGKMIDKINNELSIKLNDLHEVVVNFIAATANATEDTLKLLIELDEDFIKITEEGSTASSMHVEIK